MAQARKPRVGHQPLQVRRRHRRADVKHHHAVRRQHALELCDQWRDRRRVEMMADDAARIDEIGAAIAFAQRLGDSLTNEIDQCRRSVALPIFPPPSKSEHRLHEFVACDARTGRTIEGENAGRAAGATTQIEHAQRPIGHMSAHRARNGAPVCPGLRTIDSIELRLRHGGISGEHLLERRRAKAYAASGQCSLGAPLPPAHRQDAPRPMPANLTLGNAQHSFWGSPRDEVLRIPGMMLQFPPGSEYLTPGLTNSYHTRMESFGIALVGCGTVGTGVAKLLLEHPDRLTARAGKKLELRRIVVRDLAKPRDPCIPGSLLTTNIREVIDDPAIQVAVEVVGGVDWARQTALDLLAAGKHLVTANKALLATHGAEIFDAGRRHGRAIAFEASVAGGIPIIGALCQGLAANQILSLQGILNGTCNYILTGMTEQGRTYLDVLREAQAKGYAEADPTLDVDGTDAAHKLAILVQIAFGVALPLAAIKRRGIADIDQLDIRFARELGYTIKLLAEAWLEPNSAPDSGGQLAMHVSPVMLRQNSPLALVRDAFNAIFVLGDAVGSTLYYGRGAGQLPTASAVVADLIDMAVGRSQQTFRSLRLWSGNHRNILVRDPSTMRSRFFMRMMVEDRPGVMADITRALANHQISISSVIQHEALEEADGEARIVPLIIMTHTVSTGAFLAALAEIDRFPHVRPPSVYYPVGD
jgi:homoserine dehydrogenase